MAMQLSTHAALQVIVSLVAAERANLGTGRAWDCAAWTEATSLGADGLALDSLELLAASEVVGRFFRLHETGDENQLLGEPSLGGWARIVAASLATSPADGFTFATSGTTGLPKLCRQSMRVLQAEAQFWSARFAGCKRVVQTVGAHHIYGFLFEVLLPEMTGWPVLDVRMLHPAAVAQVLRPSDLVVGTPSSLAAVLRQQAVLPGNLNVVSATSHLPFDTYKSLLVGGAAQVVDIYGSSETGGIAARQDPATSFELLPRWQRGAVDGEIIDIAAGKAYALPDIVAWESDRFLHPAVRADGAVQVAGVNVFPARVAERLLAHPLIAECAVRLDTELPEPRLRAFIVLVQGAQADTINAVCEKWARRKFSAPERPISFEVVSQLE